MALVIVVSLVVVALLASLRWGVDSRPGPGAPPERWWPGTPR
ncbi:MAG TPA: hypothetical protein VFH74_15645 [Gaiellales bacterium]|nr:hypothetical protein [Gaiellales bacterium]